MTPTTCGMKLNVFVNLFCCTHADCHQIAALSLFRHFSNIAVILCSTIFPSVSRPGNGSPSATNVVLVLVVVISTKVFFILQPIVVELCTQIDDSIIHYRTVTEFQVNS